MGKKTRKLRSPKYAKKFAKLRELIFGTKTKNTETSVIQDTAEVETEAREVTPESLPPTVEEERTTPRRSRQTTKNTPTTSTGETKKTTKRRTTKSKTTTTTEDKPKATRKATRKRRTKASS